MKSHPTPANLYTIRRIGLSHYQDSTKPQSHRSAFSAGLSIFYSFSKGGVSIPAAFILLVILAAILFWAWLSPHYDEFGSKILNFFRQFTNKK